MVRVLLAVPQEAQGETHPRMKLKVRITALLTSFASLLIFVVVLFIAGVFSFLSLFTPYLSTDPLPSISFSFILLFFFFLEGSSQSRLSEATLSWQEIDRLDNIWPFVLI